MHHKKNMVYPHNPFLQCPYGNIHEIIKIKSHHGAALLKHAYLDELLGANPELAEGEPGQLLCAALPQLRRIVAFEQGVPRAGVQSLDDLLAGAESVPEPMLDAVSSEVLPSDDGIIIGLDNNGRARPDGDKRPWLFHFALPDDWREGYQP